jgi:hypothetical protein
MIAVIILGYESLPIWQDMGYAGVSDSDPINSPQGKQGKVFQEKDAILY